VAQRAAEGIARAEPVHNLDFDRRHLHGLLPRRAEHAVLSTLDDGKVGTELEQRLRGPPGFERLTESHRHLLGVPDDHRGARKRLAIPSPSVLERRPEHCAIVEIVDGERSTAAPAESGKRGRPTRLLREPRPGRPEQRRLRRNRPQLVELEIGRFRCAVEEQREAVGREDLAECEWRLQRRMRADQGRVDPELRQRAAHVLAERVVADLRDHGGPPAEPRCRHGDVRWAAA